MTRRPHMKLRVGDIDVVIGYEQRGNQWVLFHRNAGEAPGASQQHFYTTVLECHDAWEEQCCAAVRGQHDSHAQAADIGTRTRIAVILDDA